MHTLHICRDGHFFDHVPLETISDYLSDSETLVWLDLEAPDEAETALLSAEFNFHPLAIEDAVRHHERPKVDAYPGYYLFIFYAAAYKREAPPRLGDAALLRGRPAAQAAAEDEQEPQIDLRALSIFVGKNFIVTVHRQPVVQIAATMDRWHRPETPLGRNVGAILHALLDAIVDDYFLVMDQIVDWVEDLEDTIFGRFREGAIQEIFSLKKDLLMMRRVVSPEREVLNVLLRREIPIFRSEEQAYMQDVYDHIVRVTDTIDTYRDLLSSALDSYLSLQSNQLNQLVKLLTLSSIILMACSLVAGIYGMNFANMPELDWRYGYPFALGLMFSIALGLALLFRSRKWW